MPCPLAWGLGARHLFAVLDMLASACTQARPFVQRGVATRSALRQMAAFFASAEAAFGVSPRLPQFQPVAPPPSTPMSSYAPALTAPSGLPGTGPGAGSWAGLSTAPEAGVAPSRGHLWPPAPGPQLAMVPPASWPALPNDAHVPVAAAVPALTPSLAGQGKDVWRMKQEYALAREQVRGCGRLCCCACPRVTPSRVCRDLPAVTVLYPTSVFAFPLLPHRGRCPHPATTGTAVVWMPSCPRHKAMPCPTMGATRGILVSAQPSLAPTHLLQTPSRLLLIAHQAAQRPRPLLAWPLEWYRCPTPRSRRSRG
jgi:hypothetical protein